MEDLVITPVTPRLNLRSTRILVTGHTGFKGAWLCEWLLQAGAKVTGVALPPISPETLFVRLGLETRLQHLVCDIRDATAVADAVRRADPQIVFHLAAQALVRRSYREPMLTWETNVNGTLHVLEAAHRLARPVTVLAVTTDKVYKNREWEFAYREDDELGGHDPYSASKAACEIAVASWRASFGSPSGVTVVTARAGNVIGGGDIAEDRIVPDCFRAWRRGEAVQVRRPHSTRPWQHVLEPLSGYLALAAHASAGRPRISSCNFGPANEGHRTVQQLVEQLVKLDPRRRWTSVAAGGDVHEARTLSLSIDRARHVLDWSPRLTFEQTIAWTDAGYVASPEALPGIVERQIADFAATRPTPAA